jgi:acetyl-CoA acetyltransferase
LAQAVLVDVVRSPMGRGKPGGALSTLHPVELLAQVLSGLVGRNGIDPGLVDDVLIGCVGQVGEQSGTPGRHAWLSAGFPVSVPSTTIERRCGSGHQAIDFAVQGVQAGAYDIVIAQERRSRSQTFETCLMLQPAPGRQIATNCGGGSLRAGIRSSCAPTFVWEPDPL